LAYSGARVENQEAISPELAEAIASSISSGGRVIVNIAADARLKRAAEVLDDVVLPNLATQFDEHFAQVSAEIQDRVNIQRRAVERHKAAKERSLSDQAGQHRVKSQMFARSGEARRAQQFAALAEAAERRLKRLHQSTSQRLREIDLQCEFIPEETEVAAIFAEVVK
jgi:hypothetical protein